MCGEENCELIQNTKIKAGNFTVNKAQQTQSPITAHLFNIPRWLNQSNTSDIPELWKISFQDEWKLYPNSRQMNLA